MKERVVSIGKPSPLVGVLCEPEVLDKSKPAVLILNSGIMHHVGTCRISVKLARMLADSGYASLRFDYSGIGDSETRLGAHSFEESAPKESAEVMDFLQKRRGINTFVLFGLCSGADAAYETAKIDERVVGICQIDAYTYKTYKWNFYHYGPRMVKIGPWLRFVRKKFSQLRGRSSLPNVVGNIDEEFIEMPSYIRVHPAREDVAKGLASLVERNIGLYNIFTRSAGINHQSQYRESMSEVDFNGHLQVDYIPEAEHIMPEPDCQELIIRKIVAWTIALGS